MKKRWLLVPVLAILLLASYVVAGPYLAIRGISEAVANRDAGQLERHVDFPSLRVNLKAQLDDYLIRQAGSSMQSSLLGGFALQLASGISGAGVDTLVTPLGIGACCKAIACGIASLATPSARIPMRRQRRRVRCKAPSNASNPPDASPPPRTPQPERRWSSC